MTAFPTPFLKKKIGSANTVSCPGCTRHTSIPQLCGMIKFGTKVVCINGTFTEEQVAMIPNRPVQDEHYTVDEVLITRRGKAVTLVELDNPPLMHPSGGGTFVPSFDINRFAELAEAPEEVVEEALEAVS